MDERRALASLGQLERLRDLGALNPGDYTLRRAALQAVLPAGDARRTRLSARPIWWFAAFEVVCKAVLVAWLGMGF